MSTSLNHPRLRRIQQRADRRPYEPGAYCDDAREDVRLLLRLLDVLATAGRQLVDWGPFDGDETREGDERDVFEEALKLVEGDPDAGVRDLVRTRAGVDLPTARRLGF